MDFFSSPSPRWLCALRTPPFFFLHHHRHHHAAAAAGASFFRFNTIFSSPTPAAISIIVQFFNLVNLMCAPRLVCHAYRRFLLPRPSTPKNLPLPPRFPPASASRASSSFESRLQTIIIISFSTTTSIDAIRLVCTFI